MVTLPTSGDQMVLGWVHPSRLGLTEEGWGREASLVIYNTVPIPHQGRRSPGVGSWGVCLGIMGEDRACMNGGQNEQDRA